MPVVRFVRGALPLATVEIEPGLTLLELAENAGIHIMRNCKAGNCGSCMGTLKAGTVPLPEPLTGGLDDWLVEEGAVLTCIGIPDGDCTVDLLPPL